MNDPTRPLRILIVDDDPDDRFLIAEMLRRGFRDPPPELETSSQAADGIAAMRAGTFDLAIVDYRLPPGTGLDLLRDTRAAGLDLPILMLTGMEDERVASSALDQGASDCLPKAGLTPELLRGAILRALEARDRTLPRPSAGTAPRGGTRRAGAPPAAAGPRVNHLDREIRPPLNGVIGMLEMALETNLTVEQREYLKIARAAAESLTDVVNDVLDLSRIDSGGLNLDASEFSLRGCVGDTLRAPSLEARQKGLAVRWEVAADVPDLLVGDPGRLRQVLLNLAANAVRSSGGGEVLVRVETEVLADDRVTLHVSVRGTGPAAVPRKGGTGLSLTIAAELVNRMHGELWFESEIGYGSISHFTARFELSRPHREAGGDTGVDLRALRVLTVTDDPVWRRHLEDLLSGCQVRTAVAAEPEEALRELERGTAGGAPFDLVLLDVHGTGSDVFDLARRIRSTPGQTGLALVLLTASGQRGDAARCRVIGIDAYLPWPIEGATLRQALLLTAGARRRGQERPPLVTRHLLRDQGRRAPVLKILLAEDNRLNEMIARGVLEECGHTVVIARDGHDAVAAFETDRFDLVLMDVEMPGMDGVRAATLIRDKERASGWNPVPIVGMAARAVKGDRERCLDAGMDGSIAKPIHPRRFFNLLENLGLAATGSEGGGPAAGTFGDAGLLDRETLLREADGDAVLLRRMSDLFREQSRRLLADLAAAVERGDGEGVQQAARLLKGEVAHWCQGGAYLVARRLEERARAGDMENAPQDCTALQAEIDRLERALAGVLDTIG
jgi:CheY-like chemotaxis protein